MKDERLCLTTNHAPSLLRLVEQKGIPQVFYDAHESDYDEDKPIRTGVTYIDDKLSINFYQFNTEEDAQHLKEELEEGLKKLGIEMLQGSVRVESR